MLVWFRCCLGFRHFPQFKKNYPFYPLFILRIILFSCLFWEIRLKLRQGLTLSKDRKRIKTSVWWEEVYSKSKSMSSLILPNFKYKIVGNAYSAINDINYYEQHKKHLPIIKRIFLFFNEISIIDKFGYLILIACIIFVICLIIYTEYNKILLFG